MILNRIFFKKSIAILILLLTIFSFALQFERAVHSDNFWISSFVLSLYFTNQSNFLIFLVALFVLLNIDKKWLQYFSFIAFINITVTAIIFHIFLVPYFDHLQLVQHMMHTVNPIVYFIYYLFILKTDLKLQHSLISMIYPLCYFAFVFLIVHPLLGNLIETFYPNDPDMLYVYPFLNPNNYDNGFLGVIQLSLFKLLPTAGIMAAILLQIKIKFDQVLWQQKNA